VDALASAFAEMSDLHNTPKLKQSSSRLCSESKGRVLFPKQQFKIRWSDKEDYALTLFLMFHADGKTWVSHRDGKLLGSFFKVILKLLIVVQVSLI